MDSTLDTSILESPLPTRPNNSGHSLLSWRSILAGLIVAIMTCLALIALGFGLGGSAVLVQVENNSNVPFAFTTGIMLWLGLSILFSLSAGSYFSARTSTFTAGKMGAAHGIIITALFFGLLLYTSSQFFDLSETGFSRVLGLFWMLILGLTFATLSGFAGTHIQKSKT